MTKFQVIMLLGAIVLNANTPPDSCISKTWFPDGPVGTVVQSGGKVYFCGSFEYVGPVSTSGEPHNNIAALDAKTGAVTVWDPKANGIIRDLKVIGNSVYVIGDFDSIGGKPRNYLAAIDATTGKATDWNPGLSEEGMPIYALAFNGNTIYIGGDFLFEDQVRTIMAFDATNGKATDWSPDKNPDRFKNITDDIPVDYIVFDIAISSDGKIIYASGSF
ncbi:MAG TPA: hypothetical protein VHP36_07240 [Chitinispirillaceae bacterium]|nr:hypothetical protein [Chitinispirillaceae bacterium]